MPKTEEGGISAMAFLNKGKRLQIRIEDSSKAEAFYFCVPRREKPRLDIVDAHGEFSQSRPHLRA